MLLRQLRPKGCGMRMDNRRRRRRSGRARRNMPCPKRDYEKGSDAHAAAGRRAGEDEDEDEDEEVKLPMPGSFDFEDTTAVLHVRVSSIHSMPSVYGNGRQKYCSWFHWRRASEVRENGRR
jgi:hypothetical protein